MHTLATGYVTVDTSIPPSPAAATAPTVPASTPVNGNGSLAVPVNTLATPIDTTGTTLLAANPLPGSTQVTPSGQPGGTSGVSQSSGSGLFGDMFTVGLAAASAAAFGRFGSLMPSVPGFAKQSSGAGKKGSATATGTVPRLGAAGAAGLGAAGIKAGGGVSGLGGSGGIGGGGGAATGAPDLTGASTQAADFAGGDLAGAAGTAGSSAPMMPMMPMSGAGMGSGDMGGARRIPPWLVETEDVWGESSTVAPTVIGEGPGFGPLG